MPLTLRSSSPDQTFAHGQLLGESLQAGDVLLLDGELGSGKTRFTQGIGAGLAVQEPVKSSSFILLAEYQGVLRLYHADLFRLDDPREVADLALAENAADGVLVVEWAERAPRELPEEHLEVRFLHLGECEREIRFTPRSQRALELIEAFGEKLP